ncbi:MAG: hypothetical protein IT223_07640 [Crocinitomicaceae bacterium]|nr:hypothetical protein [Crocinitomicaceae bacterium]
MKKKIFAILLTAFAVAAIYGIYQWNKPKRTADGEMPVDTLTAEDIFAKFSGDETKANSLYLNKVVQIYGRVVDIDSGNNEVVLFLETSDILGRVSCTLIPGTNAEVAKGREIAVKGICTGFLTDVVLTQCVLVQ